MRKLSALIGLYLFLFIANNSCRSEHFRIIDIRFESATLEIKNDEKQFNDYIPTSVFTRDIVFIISYHTEYVFINTLNLNSDCYAYDPARVMNDKLLAETYSIKFDHFFTFNSDTIKANQNILINNKIIKEIQIFDNYEAFDGAGADKVFSFSDSFVKNAKFDTIDYKASFYCKTSDSLEFNKQVIVKFKLE
jgi:hypothetical protein